MCVKVCVLARVCECVCACVCNTYQNISIKICAGYYNWFNNKFISVE